MFGLFFREQFSNLQCSTCLAMAFSTSLKRIFRKSLFTFTTPFLGHSHTTCPAPTLMALFVLPAVVLGIPPEIVELEKGVDV